MIDFEMVPDDVPDWLLAQFSFLGPPRRVVVALSQTGKLLKINGMCRSPTLINQLRSLPRSA
jgi:hypothetical protein